MVILPQQEQRGLWNYQITGEHEDEAAAKLEERIDYLDHLPGVRYYEDEIAGIREKISEEFGVEIRAV